MGTLNLNGARDIKKRAMLYNLIKQKKMDVMLVQETHSDGLNENDWLMEWDGLATLSHKNHCSGGLAVLFRKSFKPVSYEIEHVIEGHLMKVTAKFEKMILVFINVYAPVVGPERVVFLNKLSDILSNCKIEEFMFIGGDFNCTANDTLDRNHKEPHLASQYAIRKLIAEHDLCDVWRNLFKEQRQYTWAQVRENTISMARLDRFYCFKYHFNVIKKCEIVPSGFSDHSLVICSVFITNIKSKSAYWHFNTSLLHDQFFKDVFSFFWKQFSARKNDFSSLQQWWDYGKKEIQQLCRQYTFNVSKDISQSLKTLEIEIVELQNLVESTGNRGHIELLKAKKKTLDNLLGIRAQGALIRSRFQSVVEMDGPTKFFFGLEKKNGQSRFIHSLYALDGTEITEPKEIRKRAVCFYSELYKSEYTEADELASSFFLGLPKVSVKAKCSLERPLSASELHVALQSMDCGKAPGIDGLPIEFYKVFWSVLGNDLLSVLNDSLTGGLLPLSCRRAVITLLPKKGDLKEIKNYRPVSLLCSDLKLFSKALAIRLRNVVGQVIHHDQTYCVPNRSIFDNVYLIRDILDVSRLLDIDTGLISLDQEKAFDRVEHSYLWRTLEEFGFSSGFIAMIRVLYQDVESVLKINGSLSAPFKIKRGIRQGCALSGMLYALAIEPLLVKIRERIEGWTIPCSGANFKLSAYADDIIVLVKGQSDLDLLKEIIDNFGVISSAKVNWSKSEAIASGIWSHGLPNLPGGLSWKRDGLKYLGVYVGNDAMLSKNWEGVLEKVKGRLEKWKWLLPKMSFRGRVIIINNLVASALWHRLACVDPPSGLLSKIQASLVDFFWSTFHWIPQSILFLPRDEGGQGLIHLPSRGAAFRLLFIQRYLTGPEDLVWRKVADVIFNQAGRMGLNSALFLMDLSKLQCNGLTPFYRGLFKVWELLEKRRLETTSSLYWLLEEPLVHGARLDVTSRVAPGMLHSLVSTKTLKLLQLLEFAGPGLNDALSLASHLGVRSVRQVEKVLDTFKQELTEEEHNMLSDFYNGILVPDNTDPFPSIFFSPNLKGLSGPFLDLRGLEDLSLQDVQSKVLYKCFVKVLNKATLKERNDTVWREKLGLDDEVKPVWRVLYKPPIEKRTGDLQWRVLHGAVAVNAFVSVINPSVSSDCPFCGMRETIFHCFLECSRLYDLFCFLDVFFVNFGEKFSSEIFILGPKYSVAQRIKSQLLNFLIGQAKLAVYMTRKNKIEGREGQHVVIVFKNLVKARLMIDFKFYKMMNDLESFLQKWCFNEAICTVIEEMLIFTTLLQ